MKSGEPLRAAPSALDYWFSSVGLKADQNIQSQSTNVQFSVSLYQRAHNRITQRATSAESIECQNITISTTKQSACLTMLEQNAKDHKSMQTLQSECPQKPDQPSNPIHHMYSALLNNLSSQYPFLSKIGYLAILLNMSSIVYTPYPDHLEDVYRHICSQMQLKERVHTCDINTSTSDIFKNKVQGDVYLLYNALDLDNKKSNDIREHLATNIVINVQSIARKEGNFLERQFSMTVVDTSTNNFKEFVKRIDQKRNAAKIDSKVFNESLAKNRTIAQSMTSSGFIKPYLEAYQLLLSRQNIKFPHSRWRKAYEAIKIIGLNKIQNEYKSLCLVDCIFVPWFLATSLGEHHKLTEVNIEIISQLSVYYGAHKFIKHLQKHFFASEDMKTQYYERTSPLVDKPSFFFPCVKYPNLVSLQIEEEPQEKIQFYYKILGQRKLMSDRYIEVDSSNQYALKLQMKSNAEMDVDVGIVCYDSSKEVINSRVSHSKEGTQIVMKQYLHNSIVVDPSTIDNLANWNHYKQEGTQQDKYGYNFCIGIYNDQTIEPQHVLKSKSLMDVNESNCAYGSIDTENGKITISQHLAIPFKYMVENGIIIPYKTKLVNYISYPAYRTFKVTPTDQWQTTKIKYSKQSTTINSLFEQATKYIRIAVIVEQHLSDKNQRMLHLKNIQFNPVPKQIPH